MQENICSSVCGMSARLGALMKKQNVHHYQGKTEFSFTLLPQVDQLNMLALALCLQDEYHKKFFS